MRKTIEPSPPEHQHNMAKPTLTNDTSKTTKRTITKLKKLTKTQSTELAKLPTLSKRRSHAYYGKSRLGTFP
jgi:hypothetical protein